MLPPGRPPNPLPGLRARSSGWRWSDDGQTVTLPGADLADLLEGVDAAQTYVEALVRAGSWR